VGNHLKVIACAAVLFAAACSRESTQSPVAPSPAQAQQSLSGAQFRSLSTTGCFDETQSSLTFVGNTAVANVFVKAGTSCVGQTIWLTSYYPDVPFTLGNDPSEPYPQHFFAQTVHTLTAGVNIITVNVPDCPYVGAQVDLAFKAGTQTLLNGEYYTDPEFVLAILRNNACASLEGCTPGYWKNHLTWPAPYTPDTLVSSVFNLSGYPADYTFMQALTYGGPVKAQILLRAAVAAALNIANSEVDYALTLAQLQTQVNTALAGSNSDKTTLNGVIDGYNNAGCPLN
jgi:hypothetical protein